MGRRRGEREKWEAGACGVAAQDTSVWYFLSFASNPKAGDFHFSFHLLSKTFTSISFHCPKNSLAMLSFPACNSARSPAQDDRIFVNHRNIRNCVAMLGWQRRLSVSAGILWVSTLADINLITD